MEIGDKMRRLGRFLLKFLKMLFSRYLIILILFILQIAFIWLVVSLLQQYYWWVRLAFYLIEIIIFFHIMNKKEAPDFKIPWIIIFFIFPVIGLVIWLFFRNHRLKRSHLRKLTEMDLMLYPYFKTNDKERNQMNVDIPEYVTHFNYLENLTHFKSYNDSHIEYFKTGESYFLDMINEMKKAKEFIYIEFFIIHRGKLFDRVHEILKEKVKEGVDVRILLDDIGSSGYMNHFYMQKLRHEGIKVHAFNKVIPIMSGIYNNRDHRKIVIIDHIAAYTGGCNMADEYANMITRFGYWKDTGCKIQGPAMNNLIALFLSLYQIEVKDVPDYKKIFDYQYETYNEGGYIYPFGDGPKPFYNELIGEGNYLNLINNAKKSVYISTPYLIPTYSLINAIRNAALRGVDIKIMLPGIPDKKLPYSMAKNYFKYLTDAGVKIYLYKKGFNHNKCVLVDSKIAFNGTINFDYRSLVHHFECGVLMVNTPCIKDIEEDFIQTFNECELVINPKKRFGLLLTLANLFAPLF